MRTTMTDKQIIDTINDSIFKSLSASGETINQRFLNVDQSLSIVTDTCNRIERSVKDQNGNVRHVLERVHKIERDDIKYIAERKEACPWKDVHEDNKRKINEMVLITVTKRTLRTYIWTTILGIFAITGGLITIAKFVFNF